MRSDGEAGVVGDRCWGEDAAVRSDGGAMAGGQKHRRDEQRKALERLVQVTALWFVRRMGGGHLLRGR